MDPIESQFNQAKNAVEFSSARKDALRQSLAVYMATHPVAAPRRWASFSFSSLFARPVSYAVAVIGLIVLAGGGTALAANNSLPGSGLYTIKTKVNEPVRAALTFNANARAGYEASLAARRVAEANTLVAQGKLDDQTQQQLAQNFNEHAREVRDRVQQLKTSQNDNEASLLATNFATGVGAEEQTFVRTSSKHEDSFLRGQSFLGRISATVNAIGKTSVSSSAVVNINDADNAIVSASASLQHKTNARNKAKDKVNDNTGVKASVEARAQLDAAQNLLGQAQAKLKSGDYDNAAQLGDKALQNVRQAQGIIDSDNDKTQVNQPVNVDAGGSGNAQIQLGH